MIPPEIFVITGEKKRLYLFLILISHKKYFLLNLENLKLHE